MEQRAADTLLQTPARVRLGGRDFSAAPPSVATLARLSGVVSGLPRFDAGLFAAGGDGGGDERFLQRVIANAEGCGALGEAVAVLLLGARGFDRRAGRGWGRWRFWARGGGETEGQRLGRWLYEHATPRELYTAFARLIGGMQVTDFFALTAFLHEANMLRRREAVATTASGR